MEIPWRRRLSDEQTKFARFINEIVVGEETDEDGRGGYISHFGLYLEAMRECGASTERIEHFLDRYEETGDLTAVLNEARASVQTRNFVENTIHIAANGKTHEVCAAFFYGREEIIPDMFNVILDEIGGAEKAHIGRLKYYLQRHIELDGDEHGPLANRLLEFLCDKDPAKIAEAKQTAARCLRSRIALWDEICADVKHLPADFSVVTNSQTSG